MTCIRYEICALKTMTKKKGSVDSMVDFFQSRDRHFSRRRRPPRTMLTTIPTTTQTTRTTSNGRRRRRRSVAMRAMRSSVDARFDEASSSSSSEASGVHVVSPGDSLYGVAVHYGVDPRDLIVRRRDFLPFFLSSSLAFFYRLFSPRRLRERERAGLLSAF